MNSKRLATGEPLVGFANPLLYSIGSREQRVLVQGCDQPDHRPDGARGGAARLPAAPTEVRVITVNSVPFVIITAPYALEVCALPICLGINDVFNYTSLSSAAIPPTPAGYNDVTGLGVPWVPKLINEE